MPLVVIGDGPLRSTVIETASKSGVTIKVLEWLDRDDVFRWLGHAAMLIFPSNWPEPLSRVLLEASALGIAIAAMNTGGTSDVVVGEQTGLLSQSFEQLARDVARLEADPGLRQSLGAAAAMRAEDLFDIARVADRMEALSRSTTQHAG
jgi:glycosyltransferase involved in cell wall biosynthesis